MARDAYRMTVHDEKIACLDTITKQDGVPNMRASSPWWRNQHTTLKDTLVGLAFPTIQDDGAQ
ncbi:MAG: hypothetical protein ACR2Q4_19880 [Geminicoccaceae bacterium]